MSYVDAVRFCGRSYMFALRPSDWPTGWRRAFVLTLPVSAPLVGIGWAVLILGFAAAVALAFVAFVLAWVASPFVAGMMFVCDWVASLWADDDDAPQSTEPNNPSNREGV